MSLPQDEITRALCRDRLEVRLVPIEYTVPEELTPGSHVDAYCGETKTAANPRGMGALWVWWCPDGSGMNRRQGPDFARCPYGKPGDRTKDGLVVVSISIEHAEYLTWHPTRYWLVTLKREAK